MSFISLFFFSVLTWYFCVFSKISHHCRHHCGCLGVVSFWCFEGIFPELSCLFRVTLSHLTGDWQEPTVELKMPQQQQNEEDVSLWHLIFYSFTTRQGTGDAKDKGKRSREKFNIFILYRLYLIIKIFLSREEQERAEWSWRKNWTERSEVVHNSIKYLFDFEMLLSMFTRKKDVFHMAWDVFSHILSLTWHVSALIHETHKNPSHVVNTFHLSPALRFLGLFFIFLNH